MPGFLRKCPWSMSHRRKSFCFILSLPLLLSKSPHHARESVGRRKSFIGSADGPRACESFPAGGRFVLDRLSFCPRTEHPTKVLVQIFWLSFCKSHVSLLPSVGRGPTCSSNKSRLRPPSKTVVRS